jgi:hypothetical protein
MFDGHALMTGAVLTVTFPVFPVAVQPLLSVTVTLYVPPFGPALAITGFCSGLVKLLGPVHA